VRSRLGEFFLYDEYDPRRTILFNDDGSVWKDGGAPDRQYFLNLSHNEGPEEFGPIDFAPNGEVIAEGFEHTDGDDVIFGDLGNDWIVGGTGRDRIYGGWGNDLMNADDVLTTNGNLNDTTDTHPLFEDRVYGGAGLDILIGNTGGDRLIDWVGEFNSFLVPFSPFGIATVSRQRPPQLDHFLYAISASDGADPTRATDTGNDPDRHGEPDGELGLVMQRDHGLWQDQTGGPTDPQPGNIPGGGRDVLRSADFNDGAMNSFAPDSGVWEVSQGSLNVAAESIGGDAAAVFYVDDYLPQYYEISARIQTQKPTAGWKANAYVFFDYYSPTDFKFAGINASIDKIQMGRRTPDGWIVDVQEPTQIKPERFYDMLVAVNGVTVTVVVDGAEWFTHAFEPRTVEGWDYPLNTGLVGIGSDNARGRFDRVTVQKLPPVFTLENTDDFSDGTPGLLTGASEGDWQVGAGARLSGTPAAGKQLAIRAADLGIGRGLQFASILELGTVVRTDTTAGLVFDQYSPSDFKFAALDVENGRVLIGHSTAKRGVVIDQAVDRALVAGQDYNLQLTAKGASISVYLNGQAITGHGFNAAVVDGGSGLMAVDGTASFDQFTVRTNDPAFLVDGGEASMLAAQSVSGTSSLVAPGHLEVQPILTEATRQWAALLGQAPAALPDAQFWFADLPGDRLGVTVGNDIYFDRDAAGHGWFLDPTPSNGGEFRAGSSNGGRMAADSSPAFGAIDLLTVATHEMGHLLGLNHARLSDVAGSPEITAPSVRYVLPEVMLSTGIAIGGNGRNGNGHNGNGRSALAAAETASGRLDARLPGWTIDLDPRSARLYENSGGNGADRLLRDDESENSGSRAGGVLNLDMEAFEADGSEDGLLASALEEDWLVIDGE